MMQQRTPFHCSAHPQPPRIHAGKQHQRRGCCPFCTRVSRPPRPTFLAPKPDPCAAAPHPRPLPSRPSQRRHPCPPLCTCSNAQQPSPTCQPSSILLMFPCLPPPCFPLQSLPCPARFCGPDLIISSSCRRWRPPARHHHLLLLLRPCPPPPRRALPHRFVASCAAAGTAHVPCHGCHSLFAVAQRRYMPHRRSVHVPNVHV